MKAEVETRYPDGRVVRDTRDLAIDPAEMAGLAGVTKQYGNGVRITVTPL